MLQVIYNRYFKKLVDQVCAWKSAEEAEECPRKARRDFQSNK